MKKNAATKVCHLSSLGRPVLLLTVFAMIWTMGCQETPLPGETYRKKASAWPLFEFEKTAGTNPDGTTWEKEKGNAAFWLSTWEKERTYDQDGVLIYRKEKSGFFPFNSDEIEETPEFRRHTGAILLFPFESYQKKGVEPEQVE